MHGIHNSDGSVFAIQCENSGQSTEFLKNGERYYLFNTNFFGYDINESSSSNSFSLTKGYRETEESFLYGNQFGYNFHFKENTEAWSDSSDNLASDNPANNAVYLKIGSTKNIPDPPVIDSHVDVTPGEVEPDVENNAVDFSIYVGRSTQF